MNLKTIKLVTFDITNTLLKFKEPAWTYYTKIANHYGFKGTEEDVKTKFKKSFKLMLEQHPNFGKKSIEWKDWWCRVVSMTLKDHLPRDADLNKIANKLIDEFRTERCWCVAHGGYKLLDHLTRQGMTIGVISNFDPRLSDILKNVNLSKNFDFIITSYDVGYSKPDKRIFKTALEMCSPSILPSEALHIGDDVIKDYEGARAAGWHAVLVNPKLSSEKAPAQEHMFPTLEDLTAAVEESKLKL